MGGEGRKELMQPFAGLDRRKIENGLSSWVPMFLPSRLE